MVFRAEVAILAGIVMSFRRMVPLRALPRSAPARVPMARERLKAMVARTSQAALAVNFPEGRCAPVVSSRTAGAARLDAVGSC